MIYLRISIARSARACVYVCVCVFCRCCYCFLCVFFFQYKRLMSLYFEKVQCTCISLAPSVPKRTPPKKKIPASFWSRGGSSSSSQSWSRRIYLSSISALSLNLETRNSRTLKQIIRGVIQNHYVEYLS